MGYFDKATSSRLGFNTVLNYTGSGVVSTTGVHVGCLSGPHSVPNPGLYRH